MHFPAAARAVQRYHNTGKDKKKVRHVLCVFRSCCNTAGHLSHLHLLHGCDGKDNSGAPVWVFFCFFFLKFMQILSDWRKASYIITTSHVYFYYFFVFLHLVNARIYKAEQKSIM